jgi:hypothetical protein
MLKHAIQMSGALSALALTASAQTEAVEYVKIADVHIKPSGYVIGSYQYTKSDAEFSETGQPTMSSDNSSDRFDLDAAKVLFNMDYKPVSGAVSVFHAGGDDSEIYLLDAYATYDFGNGSTLSGGKFLSWLGYEAFDIPNMAQITYAYANFNPIPGYHSGLKYNYTTAEYSFGVALLDSLYSPSAFKGDGSLKTDFAAEAFVSYTGVPGLTLWAGLGYQSEDDETLDNDGVAGSLFIFNTWASYTVDKSNFGAEFVFSSREDDPTLVAPERGGGFDAINLLGFYSYQFTDKVSTAFRVGFDSIEYNRYVFSPGVFTTLEENSLRLTVAPSIKVTDNLKIVFEASYSKIDSDDDLVVSGVRSLSSVKSDDLFFGVQGRFTF